MRLFERYEDETLFELDDMRSMNSIFIGKLITGMAFAYSMILMPWFLRFIFAFISVSVLVPLGKEYFFRQLRGLRLTRDFLELRRGRRGRRIQRIHFKDVRRIELIEKQQNSSRSTRAESRRTLFGKEPHKHIFHPEAKCVITMSSGNTIEVEASYFEEGDFEAFLDIFERTYAKSIGSGESSKRFKRRFQLKEAQLAKPAQPQPPADPPKSAISRRYEDLIERNRKYLKDDLALKQRLENELREAYLSVYEVLDGLDLNRLSDPEIIYEFKHPDNSSGYILKGRYLDELDDETLSTAEHLIEAYHKNLRLVEMRIAYYKKIEKRLQSFMFQEKTRHKLKALSRSLENMQSQNTERSNEHPSFVDEDEADIENRILEQLEDLSDEVHELEDLEKAILLNEHISLFKD
mgnify:CR=1 FL=1